MPLENADLRELIRKIALLNAVSHGGKAQPGPIMGRILGERADLRTHVQELSTLINDVLLEVNGLSTNEQKSIVDKEWPEMLKKEKIEEENHSRLYILAKNALKYIENMITEKNLRLFSEVLNLYPRDLRLGIMKEIKRDYNGEIYDKLLNNEAFLKAFFDIFK